MHRKIRNNCNENEKPQRFRCINKFLASKSFCKIPWLERYSSKTKKNCTTSDEMKQHFDLAFNITIETETKIGSDLKKFGCHEDICVENYWKAEKIMSQKKPPDSSFSAYFTIWSNEVSYDNLHKIY